jgi:hypothetical protein
MFLVSLQVRLYVIFDFLEIVHTVIWYRYRSGTGTVVFNNTGIVPVPVLSAFWITGLLIYYKTFILQKKLHTLMSFQRLRARASI